MRDKPVLDSQMMYLATFTAFDGFSFFPKQLISFIRWNKYQNNAIEMYKWVKIRTSFLEDRNPHRITISFIYNKP